MCFAYGVQVFRKQTYHIMFYKRNKTYKFPVLLGSQNNVQYVFVTFVIVEEIYN